MVVFDQGLEDEREAAEKKRAKPVTKERVLERWMALHTRVEQMVVNGDDADPRVTHCMCELCTDTRKVLGEVTVADKDLALAEKAAEKREAADAPKPVKKAAAQSLLAAEKKDVKLSRSKATTVKLPNTQGASQKKAKATPAAKPADPWAPAPPTSPPWTAPVPGLPPVPDPTRYSW